MTYIKLFIDYLDAIEELGDAERGRLFTALLQYARTGEAPRLSGNERFIFPMMRAQLDRDAESYAEISSKRSEAGKKSAQAKANKRKQNQQESDLPNKTNQDKDQDKDEDKDQEKDQDKENSLSAPAAAAAAALAREREEKKSENPALNRVLTEFRKNIPSPSPTSVEELTGFVDSLGAEVCLRAIYRAADAGVMKWTYIRGILRSCEREDIRSLADWDKQAAERESAKYSRGSGQNQTKKVYSGKNEDAEYFERYFQKNVKKNSKAPEQTEEV